MDTFYLIPVRSEGSIPNHLTPLIVALGKLLFNCGLLELCSRSWIWELEPNDLSKRITLCKQPWNKRIIGFKRLITEQSNLIDIKFKLIEIIEDTDQLMKFRNSVAHASLIQNKYEEFIIYDSQMKQESDDKTPPGNPTDSLNGQIISLAEINNKIDQGADLFDEWKLLWNEYKTKSVDE